MCRNLRVASVKISTLSLLPIPPHINNTSTTHQQHTIHTPSTQLTINPIHPISNKTGGCDKILTQPLEYPIFIKIVLLLVLFSVGCDKFISFTVNINNFNRRIFFEMFTKLCDIHIHTSSIEIIIINPNCLQSKVTL